MLLSSSRSTDSTVFSDYQHVYTNRPQYKPLTYSPKIEAAYSTGMFVRISKTARYGDTEENNLNINNLFSIGGLKSRSETGSSPIGGPCFLQIRVQIKSLVDNYKRYNSRNYPKARQMNIYSARYKTVCMKLLWANVR